MKLPWMVFYAASDKVVVRDSIYVKFLDKFAVISFEEFKKEALVEQGSDKK